MTGRVRAADKSVTHSLAFLQALLGDYHPRDFTIRLWEGSQWPAETDPPSFTLVLKHPGALRRMFRNTTTDLSMGEAYVYDDFDIEGNIEAVFPVADYLMSLDWSLSERLRMGWELLYLPGERAPGGDGRQAATLSGEAHSIERDRQAVTYHYDVPGDFYALWLDGRMVYSCAYFAKPEEDLDTAQERNWCLSIAPYTTRKSPALKCAM